MRCIYWQAAKPCTVKHPLVYRIRDLLRGGNPEPNPGRKVIRPGDDYGSWSPGFYPAAYPNKKTPGDAATSTRGRSKNARQVYHNNGGNANETDD